jgi:hypothetical protein
MRVEGAKEAVVFGLFDLACRIQQALRFVDLLGEIGSEPKRAIDLYEVGVRFQTSYEDSPTGRQHTYELLETKHGVFQIAKDKVTDDPIKLMVPKGQGPSQVSTGQ